MEGGGKEEKRGSVSLPRLVFNRPHEKKEAKKKGKRAACIHSCDFLAETLEVSWLRDATRGPMLRKGGSAQLVPLVFLLFPSLFPVIYPLYEDVFAL